MYEDYYGLREKPFSIQPDPDFLFFSSRHKLAYSMLEYGIENRAAFSVITGEIGCGKTTLVRHLLNNLPLNVEIGLISNTHKGMVDLLEWVMMAFDQPYENKSQVALFDAFQHFLIDEYAASKRVVLIIDEAQNLTPEALESLRMLSNINADKDQLLQVILVGQPQLKALLQQPELHQFAQRISADFHLWGLTKSEVGLYILYRLKVAGRDKPLFTHEAIMRIAEASRGIPRNINVLCDTVMVYAFSQGQERIGRAVVDEVISDKQGYGVFNAPSTENRELQSSGMQGNRRKPALVVYDQELAKEIIEKMKRKKEGA